MSHRKKIIWIGCKYSNLLLLPLLILLFIGCQQTNTWNQKADMPTARLGHATCEINGNIYVIGGYSAANAPGLTTVEMYNPKTDTWTTKAAITGVRHDDTSAVVDGIIYRIGGVEPINWVYLDSVEAYDPATDTVTTKAPMPGVSLSHTSSVVDGIIYVIGGGFWDAGQSYYYAGSRAYDPATDTWVTKMPMPAVRSHHTSSAVDGIIYVLGGYEGSTEQSSVLAYIPVTSPSMYIHSKD